MRQIWVHHIIVDFPDQQMIEFAKVSDCGPGVDRWKKNAQYYMYIRGMCYVTPYYIIYLVLLKPDVENA